MEKFSGIVKTAAQVLAIAAGGALGAKIGWESADWAGLIPQGQILLCSITAGLTGAGGTFLAIERFANKPSFKRRRT
jgi:hypothetical protein